MTNKHTISALIWAANAAVWGMVYIIEQNRKTEIREREEIPPGCVKIDVVGESPLELNYHKKMIPEFSIYQV